jgi:hypothetical protein
MFFLFTLHKLNLLIFKRNIKQYYCLPSNQTTVMSKDMSRAEDKAKTAVETIDKITNKI